MKVLERYLEKALKVDEAKVRGPNDAEREILQRIEKFKSQGWKSNRHRGGILYMEKDGKEKEVLTFRLSAKKGTKRFDIDLERFTKDLMKVRPQVGKWGKVSPKFDVDPFVPIDKELLGGARKWMDALHFNVKKRRASDKIELTARKLQDALNTFVVSYRKIKGD
jgi:hypothetical protein